MKKLLITTALSLIVTTSFSQANWKKGGNNNTPPNDPPTIGTNNTWNSPLGFVTNGIQRMLIEDGASGFADGRIAMYDVIPVGFAAQDRLHLHQGVRGPMIRFTNTATGFNGGFRVGIDQGIASLINLENTPMQFLTNDIHRLMINNGGNGNTDGFIGIGNDLTSFTPQSRLHLHQNGGNVRLQFTKNLTGNNGNNGLQIGIRGNNNPINPLRGYINMREDSPIEILTNNEQRIHVNGDRSISIGTSALPGINVTTNGYVGIGPNTINSLHHPNGLWTDVGPYSLLHLNGANPNQWAQDAGFRDWMKTGVTFTENIDFFYVGPRTVSSEDNITEFVVNWSNDDKNNGFGPDDMVFRFTSAFDNTAGNPDDGGGEGEKVIQADFSKSTDTDGRHIARFTPEGQFGLGPNFGYIQDHANYVRPQSMFHMSNFADNETWMQITNQTSTEETVTDGIRLGITSDGTAHIKQQEDLPLIFYTNNVETTRMIPSTASTLPSNPGMVGIGNFSTTTPPIDAKLDIDGDLRIRQITQDESLDMILVADPTDHNRVHWRSAANLGGGGTGITQANNGLSIDPSDPNQVQLGQANTNGVSLNGGQLLNDREIPLNGKNLLFSGFSTGNSDRVKVGGDLPGIVSAGKLNVAHIGNASIQSAITGFNSSPNYGFPIGVFGMSDQSTNVAYGVYGIGKDGLSNSVGVRGDATGGGVTNIGVWGNSSSTLSDNNTAGYFSADIAGASNTISNTAVYGLSVGNTNTQNVFGLRAFAVTGVNVYGIYSQATGGVYTWAGWFDGKLHVTGQISSTNGTVITSDAMFKQNVTKLTSASDVLSQLQPKTYHLDSVGYTQFGFDNKQHMGFVAQEVETVLPDLVSNSVMPAQYDSLGNETSAEVEYLALNYQEFIPLLVAGYQEQQQTIDDLQNEMKDLKECLQEANICYGEGSRVTNTNPSTEVNSRSIQLVNSNSIILDQNLPNPFAENTTIAYSIPDDVKDAKLMFYNMNGRIIKEMVIEERGESKLTVYGDNLESGVYTYSLIADGKLIATKKMVKQ